MIEKIRGLSIKGRCFLKDTKFKFYPIYNDRISIVFGKNGSGKSTISEGFLFLSKPNTSPDIMASLLDEQDYIIQFSSDDNYIFVFNESYIDNNVKINDDGLGTIVLLGEHVDLQTEIEKYEQLVVEHKLELESSQSDLEKYDQPKNPISPYYHWEQIKNILKQPSGWAENNSKIKGLRKNSAVTDEVIREIIALSTKLTTTELQKKYTETKDLLDRVLESSDSYPLEINQIIYKTGIDKNIRNLLSKRIEQPILTEREQLILTAIEDGRQTSIESAKKDFDDHQTDVCPYCYQTISEEYKKCLVKSINRVLNKDVDLHKTELESIKFPTISFDYSRYSHLDSDLVQKIISKDTECNNLIKKYQTTIKKKIENIYTPITVNENDLENDIGILNSLLNQLENKRKEFNIAVSKREFLQQELLNINKLIAHHNISTIYKNYQKQVNDRKNIQEIVIKKQKALRDISEHLKNLRQKKANTKLALNNINNALDYVFFSRDRLSIELRDDKYYLKSNGQDVHPKNISLGERNIIALCYFFTQIMSNQEITKMYQTEALVIIDDPISSFDFENKVGIISFLRYQISKIIKGNTNSKVLILTHDLTTMFDLNKALDEICKATKGHADIIPTTYSSLELSGGELKRFVKSRSEYNDLLQMIYKYANGDIDESNIIIGNVMRRALEAFSTFTYRKSIEDISCDVNILKMLGEHSTYFENLMYRLILHGESHFEEQIYNLHDYINFYQFISDTEKKRTAKDILCIMHFLNSSHVEAYLRSVPHAIENIKKWGKDIPINSSFDIAERPSSKKRSVKLFDLPLSAGMGNNIFDENIPYKKFETENPNCDFALKILGNSMEPEIPNGCVVLIKKAETLENGKIGAFYYNGEVYCKKLSYKGSITSLISLNTDYPPINITEEDTIKPYGEVVEIVNH